MIGEVRWSCYDLSCTFFRVCHWNTVSPKAYPENVLMSTKIYTVALCCTRLFLLLEYQRSIIDDWKSWKSHSPSWVYSPITTVLRRRQIFLKWFEEEFCLLVHQLFVFKTNPPRKMSTKKNKQTNLPHHLCNLPNPHLFLWRLFRIRCIFLLRQLEGKSYVGTIWLFWGPMAESFLISCWRTMAVVETCLASWWKVSVFLWFLNIKFVFGNKPRQDHPEMQIAA